MKTAKEVLDSMREIYSDLENCSHSFELKIKLWQLKQGDRDVTTYYNEMVALWQELDQYYDDVLESKANYIHGTRSEKRMTECICFLWKLIAS